MPEPKIIDLTQEEIDGLLTRAKEASEKGILTKTDYIMLAGSIKSNIWMKKMLLESKITIARLKKWFIGETEKSKNLNDKKKSSNDDENNTNKDEQSDKADKGEEEQPDETDKSKGHGHRPASDFKNAKIHFIAHQNLKKGDRCPECKTGKLYEIDPGSIIRIVGHPWLDVHIYQPQKLRCARCQQIFTAQLDQEIYTQSRANYAAKAIVTLLKYGGGVPFYRQMKIQETLGNPISTTETWEMTADVAESAIPIYEQMYKVAADGECIYHDDTSVKILELMKENKIELPERTGMQTTVIVSKIGEIEINLFLSGRKHAGENLNDILNERKDSSIPIQMSDGLSRNAVPDHKTYWAKCNPHCRRKFYELVSFWPKEALKVLSYYQEIFHNEKIAKQKLMSPETRLKWHREKSKPVMEAMKKYCQKLLDTKVVEPNDGFGKAIKYLFNHWKELTLFWEHPGVPVCNNISERKIKQAVKNRKNSYFFKTTEGAYLGDVLLSVIETCSANGVNPYTYFVAIQRYSEKVSLNPSSWLPWVVPKETLDTS